MPAGFDHTAFVQQSIFSNFRTAAKRVRPDEEMPLDFAPSDHDVICARGRQAFSHVGNARFRSTVALHVSEYEATKGKAEKSVIVSKIVDIIRESSDGLFVRFNNRDNRWISLGDVGAREKVGQAMRDTISKKKKGERPRSSKRTATASRPIISPHQVEKKEDITLSSNQGSSSLLSHIAYSFERDAFPHGASEPIGPIDMEDLLQDEHLLEGISFRASDFFPMSVSSDCDMWQHSPVLSTILGDED